MDERKVLIITSKGDQTGEIVKYSFHEGKVCIWFKGREEPYKYNNVVIKMNPKLVDIENKTVLYAGIPLRNIKEVLDFDGTTKVFFNNDKSKIYDSSLISMELGSHSNNEVNCLLDYWNDVAQYTNTEGESESFLKKQFSKINFIDQNSVLATYLKCGEIEHSALNSVAPIYPFRFNLSQKEALEQAMLSNISIIQGPPGTGKTQTILNILANLTIMQNKSVAVVSGNNAAVQNVKDKLQKSGYGFLAALLGKVENREAFFKNLPTYQIEGWNNKIPEEKLQETLIHLSQRLDELLTLVNRKARLDQEIAAYRLEQKHFLFHNEKKNMEEMERLFFRRQTSETIISFLVDEYFLGNRSFRFLHKVKLLFKYGFIDFKKLKKNRLELVTRLQMKYYESKLAEMEQERKDIQQKLDTESFDDLLLQHEVNSSLLFRQKLYHRYQGKSGYRGNAKNYTRKFEEFLEYFPIVLSTTHSLRSCIPEGYLFDYVIVDEASQVDLLTGVLAMSCCRRMIIVGDMKQLPQVVDEKIKDKLKVQEVQVMYDYFQQSLLSSMLAIYGEKVPKVMLKEHYRCRPSIIGFCNNQYYNNELIPLSSEEESDVSIRVHYTAIGNHMRKVTAGKQTGRFNHREIETVKEEILKELQLQNYPLEDIGFTTPYRLQVKEANEMLEDEMEIDTVHRYQGREKPIIIMSTVLDQTKSGQIGKNFVENSCLVNVAVSRAQKQFILVTDHSLFRNSRKDIGNLIRYIEYHTLHEHITHSNLISVFDLLYSEYSERLNDLQSRLIYKSSHKSENIIWRVLSDLIGEESYKGVTFSMQVYLKDIFYDTERLVEAEKRYINNRASFDFVIYDAINKQPLLAIEVDGFGFHRNKPEQTERDKLKNGICNKYQFPLLRLPTTGSNEITKIRNQLDRILDMEVREDDKKSLK
ncbi:AAA domain-containing protein [Brevibacillus brevis]|nr:AAA domain-containing protein [Brevibacillus brevis]